MSEHREVTPNTLRRVYSEEDKQDCRGMLETVLEGSPSDLENQYDALCKVIDPYVIRGNFEAEANALLKVIHDAIVKEKFDLLQELSDAISNGAVHAEILVDEQWQIVQALTLKDGRFLPVINGLVYEDAVTNVQYSR